MSVRVTYRDPDLKKKGWGRIVLVTGSRILIPWFLVGFGINSETPPSHEKLLVSSTV